MIQQVHKYIHDTKILFFYEAENEWFIIQRETESKYDSN